MALKLLFFFKKKQGLLVHERHTSPHGGSINPLKNSHIFWTSEVLASFIVNYLWDFWKVNGWEKLPKYCVNRVEVAIKYTNVYKATNKKKRQEWSKIVL